MTAFTTSVLVTVLLVGTSMFGGLAAADPDRGEATQATMMQGRAHHGSGPDHQEQHTQHHGQEGRDHAEHHARHHGRGDSDADRQRRRHHGAEGHHGPSAENARRGGHWRQMLSSEQLTQLEQLRVTHIKSVAPIKADMRARKVELAVLATDDTPDSAVIGKKIDELLDLKRNILRKRYLYIAEVRTLLTVEQRTVYDLDMLRSVKHGRMRHHGSR